MFELPKLPFAPEDLEPFMSQKTLEFHHGKHHQAYVTNLNNLIKDTDLADADLETIIKETAGKEDKAGIFNNAAQVWNHTFFWNCLKPAGGGALPDGAFKDAVLRAFESEEKFKDELKAAADKVIEAKRESGELQAIFRRNNTRYKAIESNGI